MTIKSKYTGYLLNSILVISGVAGLFFFDSCSKNKNTTSSDKIVIEVNSDGVQSDRWIANPVDVYDLKKFNKST